ncbi:unnamed protein product [Protopolystoma xenopodis]|uniref:Ig-like domain-containing protein n=1 Tax=Protopolystoma xenopodis TaxID=117903 RepID=A0A3S5B9C4_9PLAT|nr:unnamed protein product [Protopolystoma xenopodis]
MSWVSTKIYSYYRKSRLQLFCYALTDVEPKYEWKLNGGPLPPNVAIEYHLVSSTLFIDNAGPENEGLYSCEQNSIKMFTHLIFKTLLLNITVHPPIKKVQADFKQPAEFQCRLAGYEEESEAVFLWSFQPDSASLPGPLPDDVILQSTGQYIKIWNPQVSHSGKYLCSVLGRTSHGQLIVQALGESLRS